MQKKSLFAMAMGGLMALALTSSAGAVTTVLEDFSGSISVASHPAGAGQYNVWYDITSDAFASDPTIASGAGRIVDGGFTNGVYVIYGSAIPTSGRYYLTADVAVDESGAGSDTAIGAYQVGVSVGASAAHRAANPSDLAPTQYFGSFVGLTTGDDTGLGFQTITVGPFLANAGEDVLVAFSTDTQSGNFDLNSAGWTGSAVLVDNITLESEAPVVINEIYYDPAGTDTGEYIELYNTSSSSVDISSWVVQLVNGASGASYAPAPITIPTTTTLAAGDYYVIGNATTINAVYAGVVDQDVSLNNLLQNGNPDGVILYDDSNVRQDSLTYDGDATFVAGTFTDHATEEGSTGRTVSYLLTNSSRNVTTGRLPNGADTDKNIFDFATIPASPGSANAGTASAPFSDNFDGSFDAAWRAGFVENRVTSPVVALGVSSSQGGDVLEVVDTTGGGDSAYIPMDESVMNVTGEIYIPADAAASAGWSIGIGVAERGNCNWFSDSTGNGLESGFYLEYQNSTGITRKGGAIPGVSAPAARLFALSSEPSINSGSVANAVATVLGAEQTGVNKGAFNPFRLYWDNAGNRLYAEINGNTIYNGVIPAGTYNQSGGLVVGFHEEHAGTPSTSVPREGAYVDAITINTTAPAANNAPTSITLSATTIAENNTPPSTVGSLSTVDESFDTHTYTLVTGAGSTDNASFVISGSDLQLNEAADFETQASYSVRVRSTDQALNTIESAFTITVTDVFESTVTDWRVLDNE